MTEALRFSLETAPGFTCRARLNDWPPTKWEGHTSAPCLVQALVRRPADLGHVSVAPVGPDLRSVSDGGDPVVGFARSRPDDATG